MKHVQERTDRCECGGVRQITATASPYEFDYACRRCSRRGVISWAHAYPPPVFAEALTESLPLFAEGIHADR